ncbi:hypothetical protein [Actinomycetospora aeridis]|uniref:Uncharacterized protein n=1 Tax=Actinomycetospora aeridis TaxID=3129231 RepID=A0ABU8N869_9PSEU
MATGGGEPERISFRRWTALGVGCATLGLAVLFFGPSRVATVAGATLVLVGALTFVAGVIASIIRSEIRRAAKLVAETMGSSALSTLSTIPPARGLESLLGRVYGDSKLPRDVLTALLGGEGEALDGGDATISERTEVYFQLSRVDRLTYRMVMEERYTFRARVPTTSFVIFATSDTSLRDNIIAACRLPLFELWFVRDDPVDASFEESVESIRDTVHIGMRYTDADDSVHSIEPQQPGDRLREVKLQDWGKYLSFFHPDLPGGAGLDRRLYMSKLRIFEVDLHRLAPAGRRVVTIEELTIRSTTLQLLADGFCYWQAPFPCFVERMAFDTSAFDLEYEGQHWFHLKPFTMTTSSSPSYWSGADGVTEVPLGAWLFPGHGVALVWRELA